jgi:hypothetical protein
MPKEPATRTTRLAPVFPDLGRAARVRGKRQPLRIWTLIRTDQLSSGNQTGWLSRSQFIARLLLWGWSRSRAYSLLAEGMDELWHEENRQKKIVVRGIHLRSPESIASIWGVLHLRTMVLSVPMDQILPPPGSNKQKGVHKWNGLLWLSQFS